MAKLAFRLLLAFALLLGSAPNYLVHSHRDAALHHTHEAGQDAFASHADHHDSQLAIAVELALDMDMEEPTGSKDADTALFHVHAVSAQAAVVPAGLAVPLLVRSDNYACRRLSACQLRAWVLPELRPPIA